MRPESIFKAFEWRQKHYAHVVRLESIGTVEHEPSGEDENHPELWKPASWRWFRSLENHPMPQVPPKILRKIKVMRRKKWVMKQLERLPFFR